MHYDESKYKLYHEYATYRFGIPTDILTRIWRAVNGMSTPDCLAIISKAVALYKNGISIDVVIDYILAENRLQAISLLELRDIRVAAIELSHLLYNVNDQLR